MHLSLTCSLFRLVFARKTYLEMAFQIEIFFFLQKIIQKPLEKFFSFPRPLDKLYRDFRA